MAVAETAWALTLYQTECPPRQQLGTVWISRGEA